MKSLLNGALCCLLVASCTTTRHQQEPQEATQVSIAEAQRAALINSLPGVYSNFDQSHGSDGNIPTVDLVVRHLSADDRSAFLFSSEYRESGERQQQVYLLRPAADEDVIELQFAPVDEQVLTGTIPQIMAEASRRVRPGCRILLAPTSNGLVGESRADTCRFEHPTAGTVGLTREISFGRGTLLIAERMTNDSGQPIAADAVLSLQKHQNWDGWAGIRADENLAADNPAAWRLATPFSVRDDGRVAPLVDAAGDAIGYGIQLAYLSWHSNKPPFLRLAVIDIETGKLLAYSWSVPGAAQLGMNLDWLQVGLQRQSP
jgi:hypothetical protein